MFGFNKNKKKIHSEIDKLLSDDNLTHITRQLLDLHRQSIGYLAKLTKQHAPIEEQEAAYNEICKQELFIKKFGHVFIIESAPPYAYCVSLENYAKFLRLKNTSRFMRDALKYYL